jgi:hypothetical protein
MLYRMLKNMIFPFAVTVSNPETGGRAGDNHVQVYETRPAPPGYRATQA